MDISERRFPARVRADIQRAIDALPENGFQIVAFHGVQNDDHYQGLTLAGSMQWKDYPATIPAAYEDVDIGSNETIRVVKNGLWLLKQDEEPVAIMVSRLQTPCGPSYSVLHVQSYDTSAGKVAAKKIVDWLEAFIQEAPSYRGKILSLEALEDAYSGAATGIRVHKLRDVERDQIILPDSTLKLLERNVIQFTRNRAKLASFGQSTRKGLLFYGPPGTGKTHTIHYLTRALEGHTTLIISAEQVQDLADYMALARLLQPSIVVLEDVDLIARDRGEMHSPQQESLLNKLLNEMDGLKEDAEILFILTTNRPEALEAALASRPGRVDQAIEFPLPNEEGRAKLVQLYSLGMNLSPDCIAEIVRRTEGVSASFIKELMRRSVQFHLEHNGSETVSREDVDNALDEMLFHGGKLNLKLLGASSRIGYQTVEA
ncbi:AAA family ATPase [Blastopirellula marina]|uniref:AAA family ATPase n=1 Tax=Blastopirellula marina TaxID=124 RepID=UPI0018EB5D49|nr:ATP-binding protein [Blastopirellula marina]